MAENVPQSIEMPVPLELFGSLVTEMAASDLPEGISPDNQDIVYLPGGVQSRPCLDGWLNNLLPANTTVTYQKTFTTTQGISLNLILTSDGSMFVQNPNTPSILTKIASVAPGSYCNSVSAFGRELFTFHDGIKGTDIPRTFDGVNFDRATQNGPGAPCTLANLTLPSVDLVIGSASAGVTITSITPINPEQVQVGGGSRQNEYNGGDNYQPPYYETYYTSLSVLTTTAHGLTEGQAITISGNTLYNLSAGFVQSVINPTSFTISYFNQSSTVGTGGSVVGSAPLLIRSNNQVTASTASPHGLRIGNQVTISGVTDSTTPILSLVVDNETLPGIATVTTTSPHGFVPGVYISISGVMPANAGTSVTLWDITNNLLSMTTSTPHFLQIGDSVIQSTNGLAPVVSTVSAVLSATQVTITFPNVPFPNSSGTTNATLQVAWPLATGSVIQVETVPTPTTFTVQVSSVDGTWTTGNITFSWNGTFFVTSTPTSTSFTYYQPGPNDIIHTGTGSEIATPAGQITPGVHGCVVLFQTRNGLVTAPSSSVQITASGGGYLTVSNVPLGPSNVISRILAFTGADGGNYFYIPQPAQVNSMTVSTSTVIRDNTTTTAVFDFSDNTLFDSIAIDIAGNNLFNLQTLGPCLGVLNYASRAGWYGMRNSIPNLVNLGFEGGYLNLNNPLGWTVATAGGVLDSLNSDFGQCWLITGTGADPCGQITQNAFQDAYQIAILQPSTLYSTNLRLGLVSYVGGKNGNLVIDFYSTSAGILASTVIKVSDISSVASFHELDFNLPTGIAIPQDTVLRIYGEGIGVGTQVSIDEIEIYPTLHPFVTTFSFSYINKPEATDGVTGLLGATDDDTPLQTSFVFRDALLFLTSSGLHETNDSAGSEPYGWSVRSVSQNCGACGPRVCSDGENFSVWITSPTTHPPSGRGLYIYTGGNVYKISQEIQPDFDRINPAAQSSIWTKVDPVTRRIYCGLPLDAATAPNQIYVLDFREMDTAADIASKSPIHISFSGKMVCSDLSRKWTRWNISANCGNILDIPGIGVQFTVGAGNGEAPGQSAGFANSYWFNSSLYTDQDYGQVNPYYTTYFFINHEAEMQMQVGLHRKLYKRWAMYVQGIGIIQLVPYGNTLANPSRATTSIQMNSQQFFDIGGGLNVRAERCAFKIRPMPLPTTTDVFFNLGKLIITLCQEPVSPIRFGAV